MLAPGTPVLARLDSGVHVGCDPTSAVVLRPPAGVDPRAVADLLQSIRVPVSYREIAKRVRAAGLDAASFRALLEPLVATGKAALPCPRRPLPVHVSGTGDLAAGLAAALRSAGHDVDDVDRGTGLVVLVDRPVPDPTQIAALMEAGTPHLSVHLRDGVGVVGPLVLPGMSSCLHCIDLHRADLDPQWPVLAASLSRMSGSAPATVRQATVATAVAHVDEIVALRTSGSPGLPTAVGRTFEYAVGPTRMSSHVIAPHARCGYCRGQL
ncbi:hypothetical protein GCM10023197_44690 [Gordonia humi]|uniref:hypothetical protein n=1 Tax=Gordonia humi TaxID=686429 RepID=UPI00336FA05F